LKEVMMKPVAKWFCAVVVAIALALLPPVYAGAQTDSQSLDTIFRTWTERQEHTHSLVFEWTQQTKRNPSISPPGARKSASSQQSGIRTILQHGELHIDGNRFDYRFGRQNDRLASMREVFDGSVWKKLTEFRDGTPEGLVQWHEVKASGGNVDLMPIFLAYRGVHADFTGMRQENCTLSPQRGVVDGRECLMVEQSFADIPATNQYWVDLARDWMVVRFVNRIEGKERLRQDVEYTQDPAHGWIPTKWNMVFVDEDGSWVVSKTYEVTRYTLNEPIAPERFELSFPPGTQVDNRVQNQRYVQAEHADKRGIMARIWPWLAVPVGMCVVAILWYVVRRRRIA
jgi:hypothetical protein